MTQYIVTGRNQGVPRPPHVDLIPDEPNTVFSATFDSDVEAELIGSGLIATYPLPHDVTVRGTPSAGQVPTATSATDATWQNGGGGVTVPLALEAAARTDALLELGITGEAEQRIGWTADGGVAWSDGVNPPSLALYIQEFDNTSLHMIPLNGGSSANIDIFGGDVSPVDGGGNAPNINFNAGTSHATVAVSASWDNSKRGGASMDARVVGGASHGAVQVLADADVDPTTAAISIGLFGGPTLFSVTYDGGIVAPSLPTSDPTIAGALWNNAGVLNVSAG